MIHLVGTNHKDRRHDSIIKKYVHEAAKNKLAVFLEGLPTDTKKTMRFCKQAFEITGGLVFGYETEIANAICHVLLTLGYCRAPNMKKDALIGNLQTCYDIVTMDEMNFAWRQIAQYLSPGGLSLYESVNEILRKYKGANEQELINIIYQNHQELLDSPAWVEIYQHLYFRLIELVPQDLQGVLKDDRVNIYLSSDQNKEQEYVVYEINDKWREQFIVRNIINTIESQNLRDKEVFIFIGSGHIRGMLLPLMKSFGRVDIVNDANKLSLQEDI